MATWGSGSSPARNADLHWNGSAWVACPINTENVAGVRDAQANANYDYCDGFETGSSNRTTEDISGRTLADVMAQLQAAGNMNLSVADPAVLGSASFPAGSTLGHQTTTPATTAYAYYPGSGSFVLQYSAAVSAGGTAASQPAGTGCNSSETTTGATIAPATLEAMVASATGRATRLALRAHCQELGEGGARGLTGPL